MVLVYLLILATLTTPRNQDNLVSDTRASMVLTCLSLKIIFINLFKTTNIINTPSAYSFSCRTQMSAEVERHAIRFKE